MKGSYKSGKWVPSAYKDSNYGCYGSYLSGKWVPSYENSDSYNMVSTGAKCECLKISPYYSNLSKFN